MNLWNSLDRLHRDHDVLQHPFYRRWSAGTLTKHELATYAAQYAHAVRALAAASGRAAEAAPAEIRAGLHAHAEEEADHIDLWADFSRAVGADPDALPTPETSECVSAWDDPDRDLDEILTALYAIESAQPRIAQTKLEGLGYYGLNEPRAAAYFELHRRVDHDHAAAAGALLEQRGATARPGLTLVAELVWSRNWLLLDGVDRLAATGADR